MSTSKNNMSYSNVRVIVSEKTTHSEHDVAKGHKYISVFSNLLISSKNDHSSTHSKRITSCKS